MNLLQGLPANGTVSSNLTIDTFEMAFSQIMDPATVNNGANFDLRSAGTDGVFGTGDDDVYSLTMTEQYLISTNRIDFDIGGGPLGYGEYRFTIHSGGLQNPFGTDLDGNGDGTGGDDYVDSFEIAPPPPTAISPSGSLIYYQNFADSILTPSDTDNFSFSYDPGQNLAVVVQGSGALIPTIQVHDPNGVLISDVIGSGSLAQTASLPIGIGGAYTITVGGSAGSIGGYEINLLLNSGIEQEMVGGTNNDSMANAQSLGSTASAWETVWPIDWR